MIQNENGINHRWPWVVQGLLLLIALEGMLLLASLGGILPTWRDGLTAAILLTALAVLLSESVAGSVPSPEGPRRAPAVDAGWLQRALAQARFCPLCGRSIQRDTGACWCCPDWDSRLDTLYFRILPGRTEVLSDALAALASAEATTPEEDA